MAQSSTSKIAKRRPNYFYVIVSVAIMLFFLGFFGAVLLNTQNLVDFFKEQVSIMIELEDSAADNGLEQLRDELYQSTYLKDSSIVFVTKEAGAQLLQEEFGEDFLSLDMPNPLYDILTFRVKAAYLHPDSLSTIRLNLKRYPFVSDVFYQENLINEMAQNVESLAYFAFGISLFLIAIAILLIHNTIRLALYANRFLIKNMQLVGASWRFISRPYLWRSFGHGVLSALIAIGGLLLLYLLLRSQFYQLDEISSWWETGLLFLGLIGLGASITTLSTYYVVNKYLRMREDDLY
jgi:cell division transport system permease protein